MILLLTVLSSSCTTHEFDRLDKIMDNSALYEKAFRDTADSLILELRFAYSDSARWVKSLELNLLYRKNNVDSTDKYIRLMRHYCPDNDKMRLITDLSTIWNLIHSGKHTQAVGLFESLTLPEDADGKLVATYYKTGYDCYSQNFDDASKSEEYVRKYDKNAIAFWLRDSTSATSIDIHSRYIRRKGNVKEAIELLESIERDKMTDLEYAQVEYHLAKAYQLYGNEEEYKRHIINAASQDLANNSKIYVSLNEISTLLLHDNDLKRANRYVDKAIRDAIECNYDLGIKRSASLALLVNNELNHVERIKKTILYSALGVMAVFCGVVLCLLLNISTLLRKLKNSNSELEAKTKQLDDASRIKDVFLASSMELAAYYINQVDEKKKTMRRILKQEGVEALAASLRAPSYSDSEHINFNSKFDEAFLKLFPDFIRELNGIMKEDKKFQQGEDSSLNTELRILALIRLGIDESPRIAKILFISKGTVYTYRCNMRMAASCNPDEFEDIVKRLG